jgi:hypothetical protein
MVEAGLALLAALVIVAPAPTDFPECIGPDTDCPWTNNINFYELHACVTCLVQGTTLATDDVLTAEPLLGVGALP